MKNEFTCLIIDDEPFQIGLLSDSLKDLYTNINIVGTYTRWKDGLEALRIVDADLIFLDISIEGKNSMDFLKIVPDIKGEVIFVSAYSEFALDAFKTTASGYLVKPVGDTDLSMVIDKAIERIRYKKAAKQIMNGSGPLVSKVSVPNGKGVNYFDSSDIIYFEAIRNYTKVVCKTETIVSSLNIGKYLYIVENKSFFQVHRSFIVNINEISRYESSGVIITSNKKEIPVARNFREEFVKLFTL